MDKPTPPTPPTPKAAWSVAEFCVRYNLSKGAAFKLIREQEIERVKFGRRTLIPVESAGRLVGQAAEGELMSRRPAPITDHDMNRCLRAWHRRTEAARGILAPMSAYKALTDGRRLFIELQNINGVLATYSVTPKRVTLLRGDR